MSNLIIPGNVKQQYSPFVLNPSNPIHGDDDTKGTPQYFTFKDKDSNSYDKTKYGTLGIVPATFKQYMKDDLANKLLYNRDQKAITYQDIFNSLPMIQIREFLPDSKLDQCLNLFGDLIKSIKGIFTAPKNDSQDPSQTEATKPKPEVKGWDNAKRLINTIWYTFKYIIGIGDEGSLVGSMFVDKPGLNTKSNGKGKNNNIFQLDSDGQNKNVKVTDFPYAFYYRMQSCTTTGIYEIPGIIDSKVIANSNGAAGWDSKDTGFQMGKLSILPKFMKNILGNIGIQWAPFWNPESGIGTTDTEVVVKFTLFNDTDEQAMNNFLFISNLIPNNRWIQYGLFEHSGALYDVKLEGYNRLFCCTGVFEVQMGGVLRDPPDKWIDDLVDSHGNKKLNAATAKQSLKKSKAIKIPDIYNVTMTFNSLLPQNFNTWLFQYTHNFSNFEEYATDSIHDASFVATALPLAIKSLGEAVTNYWDNWTPGKKDESLNSSADKEE